MCETPRPDDLPAIAEPVPDGQTPTPEGKAPQAEVHRPEAEGAMAIDLEVSLPYVLAEVVPEDVPPASPRVACRGIWEAVAWCLVLLVVDFVVGVQLGIVGARTGWKPDIGTIVLLSGAVNLGVAIFALRMSYRGCVRRIAAIRLPAFAHGVIAIVLPLPLAVAILACSAWTGRWSSSPSGTSAVELRSAEVWPLTAAPAPSRWAFVDEKYMELARQSWFIVIVAGCLLPAMGEELFFRAFLGRGLIARFGGVVGVAVTSLLFGLFHLTPERILWAAIIGVVMHIVYLSSKSILAPMAVHFLNNLLVLAASRWIQDGSWMPTEAGGVFYMPLGLWMAAVAAVGALMWSNWRGRVRWIALCGEAWTPGFLSAEMPPAGVARVARSTSVALRCAATGGFLCFAALLAPTAWNWAALTFANRALALSSAGEHAQAIAESERAFAMAPRLPWVRICQGSVHFCAGDHGLALQHYDEALRLEPNSAAAYAGRAAIRVHQQQYEDAVADSSVAIRLDPNNAEAYGARAAASMGLGRYADAIRDADTAIALKPDDFAPYSNRGTAHHRLGNDDRALNDFADAIRLAPGDAYSYSARASVYLARQEYDRAAADATEAVRREPNHAGHYQTRGEALAGKGDYDGAIKDFSRAIELQAGTAELYRERATAQLARKDYHKAIADCDEFLRMCPEDAQGYALRATARRAAGTADAAERDEKRSRELLVAQYLDSGRALLENGQSAAALDPLNKALALDPQNGDAYELRASAYARLSRRDAAIADYDTAARLAPDHANVYLERGRLLLEEKQREKALGDFTQFIRLRPGESAGFYWRAQVYRELGRTRDADADERRMLERLAR